LFCANRKIAAFLRKPNPAGNNFPLDFLKNSQYIENKVINITWEFKTMTTLEKLEELVYRGFQETKELQKETERRFQDTDRLLKDYAREQKADSEKLRSQVYGLTKSLGLFAESMVYPSVVRLFTERGIALTGAYTRSRERRNGSTMEVDVLGVGSKSVVAIEVKTRLEQSDVKEFLKRLPQFFEFFPRFRGLKLYGAIAGMSNDKEVDRYAYKNGLFVLAPSGDNVQILNDEKFIPRVFGETSKKDQRRKK
jgi:hypothetical protein